MSKLELFMQRCRLLRTAPGETPPPPGYVNLNLLNEPVKVIENIETPHQPITPPPLGNSPDFAWSRLDGQEDVHVLFNPLHVRRDGSDEYWLQLFTDPDSDLDHAVIHTAQHEIRQAHFLSSYPDNALGLPISIRDHPYNHRFHILPTHPIAAPFIERLNTELGMGLNKRSLESYLYVLNADPDQAYTLLFFSSTEE